MKYLEKSFTLPTANREMSDEQWAAIWNPPTPATESENPAADTVAPGAWYEYENLMAQPELMVPCPNCHCRPDSYRHIETCVTPGESD